MIILFDQNTNNQSIPKQQTFLNLLPYSGL